jgi:hypothetical protein
MLTELPYLGRVELAREVRLARYLLYFLTKV